MPSKPSIEKLVRKHLGKESAGKLLKKIDAMGKQGVARAKVEKMISAQIEKEICAVIAKISSSKQISGKLKLALKAGTEAVAAVTPST
ncbi:MAG: hypothetical protein LAO21_17495 [Acidobacteriia bacterium]|nr:hypothetical protein [Terriglobia bacterium]